MGYLLTTSLLELGGQWEYHSFGCANKNAVLINDERKNNFNEKILLTWIQFKNGMKLLDHFCSGRPVSSGAKKDCPMKNGFSLARRFLHIGWFIRDGDCCHSYTPPQSSTRPSVSPSISEKRRCFMAARNFVKMSATMHSVGQYSKRISRRSQRSRTKC